MYLSSPLTILVRRIARYCALGSVCHVIASDGDGGKLLADPSPYFGSHVRRQQSAVHHFVKCFLNNADGQRARDPQARPKIAHLVLKFFDALGRREHDSSPVELTVNGMPSAGRGVDPFLAGRLA